MRNFPISEPIIRTMLGAAGKSTLTTSPPLIRTSVAEGMLKTGLQTGPSTGPAAVAVGPAGSSSREIIWDGLAGSLGFLASRAQDCYRALSDGDKRLPLPLLILGGGFTLAAELLHLTLQGGDAQKSLDTGLLICMSGLILGAAYHTPPAQLRLPKKEWEKLPDEIKGLLPRAFLPSMIQGARRAESGIVDPRAISRVVLIDEPLLDRPNGGYARAAVEFDFGRRSASVGQLPLDQNEEFSLAGRDFERFQTVEIVLPGSLSSPGTAIEDLRVKTTDGEELRWQDWVEGSDLPRKHLLSTKNRYPLETPGYLLRGSSDRVELAHPVRASVGLELTESGIPMTQALVSGDELDVFFEGPAPVAAAYHNHPLVDIAVEDIVMVDALHGFDLSCWLHDLQRHGRPFPQVICSTRTSPLATVSIFLPRPHVMGEIEKIRKRASAAALFGDPDIKLFRENFETFVVDLPFTSSGRLAVGDIRRL